MRRRSKGLDPDLSAFEVGDAPNAPASEYLEAADMRTGQHCDTETAVDGRDVFRRIFEPQIQFSAGERLLHAPKWRGQVADICEAFTTQQLVRDILRSEANAESRTKCHRRVGQKAASCLPQCH